MSIKKNTAINLSGAILSMAVMFVTVPLYLNILGEARYGILAMVWLILGYFSFLDFGLGKAVSNQIAKEEQSEPHIRSDIFWNSIIINLGVGIFIALLLCAFSGSLIEYTVQKSEKYSSEIISLLPWLIAMLPIALISSVLNGALEGRREFLALNILQVAGGSIFQVTPLIGAWLIVPTLDVAIPIAIAARIAFNFVQFYFCVKLIPVIGYPKTNSARMKSLIKYGGWTAISSATVPLLETIERFIIGIVAGATSVTHYVIPMQLVGKLKVVPSALCRAMFPILSLMNKWESNALAQAAIRPLSWTMTIMVLIGLVVMRPFITLWVGEDIAKAVTPLGEILLLGIWFNGVSHVPYFLLQSQGRPDVIAKVQILELPIYTIAAWAAAQWFGLVSVALVWVCRCVIEGFLLYRVSGLKIVSSDFLLLQILIVVATFYSLHEIDVITNAVRLWMLSILLIGFVPIFKLIVNTQLQNKKNLISSKI